MVRHNIFHKEGLAALLKESGFPLSSFQNPDNHFYLVKHDKSQAYRVVEFKPREHKWSSSWTVCYQVFIPTWLKSFDDFYKSKRIKMRGLEWEQHPHDGCYFESYTGSWLIVN